MITLTLNGQQEVEWLLDAISQKYMRVQAEYQHTYDSVESVDNFNKFLIGDSLFTRVENLIEKERTS